MLRPKDLGKVSASLSSQLFVFCDQCGQRYSPWFNQILALCNLFTVIFRRLCFWGNVACPQAQARHFCLKGTNIQVGKKERRDSAFPSSVSLRSLFNVIYIQIFTCIAVMFYDVMSYKMLQIQNYYCRILQTDTVDQLSWEWWERWCEGDGNSFLFRLFLPLPYHLYMYAYVQKFGKMVP